MKPIEVYKQFHVSSIRSLQETLQQEESSAESAMLKASRKAKRAASAKAGLKIPAPANEVDRWDRDFSIKAEGISITIRVEIDTSALPESAAYSKARALRKTVCDLASTSGAAKFATWANMRNGGEAPNPKALQALLREWVEFSACKC